MSRSAHVWQLRNAAAQEQLFMSIDRPDPPSALDKLNEQLSTCRHTKHAVPNVQQLVGPPTQPAPSSTVTSSLETPKQRTKPQSQPQLRLRAIRLVELLDLAPLHGLSSDPDSCSNSDTGSEASGLMDNNDDNDYSTGPSDRPHIHLGSAHPTTSKQEALPSGADAGSSGDGTSSTTRASTMASAQVIQSAVSACRELEPVLAKVLYLHAKLARLQHLVAGPPDQAIAFLDCPPTVSRPDLDPDRDLGQDPEALVRQYKAIHEQIEELQLVTAAPLQALGDALLQADAWNAHVRDARRRQRRGGRPWLRGGDGSAAEDGLRETEGEGARRATLAAEWPPEGKRCLALAALSLREYMPEALHLLTTHNLRTSVHVIAAPGAMPTTRFSALHMLDMRQMCVVMAADQSVLVLGRRQRAALLLPQQQQQQGPAGAAQRHVASPALELASLEVQLEAQRQADGAPRLFLFDHSSGRAFDRAQDEQELRDWASSAAVAPLLERMCDAAARLLLPPRGDRQPRSVAAGGAADNGAGGALAQHPGSGDSAVGGGVAPRGCGGISGSVLKALWSRCRLDHALLRRESPRAVLVLTPPPPVHALRSVYAEVKAAGPRANCARVSGIAFASRDEPPSGGGDGSSLPPAKASGSGDPPAAGGGDDEGETAGGSGNSPAGGDGGDLPAASGRGDEGAAAGGGGDEEGAALGRRMLRWEAGTCRVLRAMRQQVFGGEGPLAEVLAAADGDCTWGKLLPIACVGAEAMAALLRYAAAVSYMADKILARLSLEPAALPLPGVGRRSGSAVFVPVGLAAPPQEGESDGGEARGCSGTGGGSGGTDVHNPPPGVPACALLCFAGMVPPISVPLVGKQLNPGALSFESLFGILLQRVLLTGGAAMCCATANALQLATMATAKVRVVLQALGRDCVMVPSLQWLPADVLDAPAVRTIASLEEVCLAAALMHQGEDEEQLPLAGAVPNVLLVAAQHMPIMVMVLACRPGRPLELAV